MTAPSRDDPAGRRGSPNSRNGTSPKTLGRRIGLGLLAFRPGHLADRPMACLHPSLRNPVRDPVEHEPWPLAAGAVEPGITTDKNHLNKTSIGFTK